jgi:hypothetical protein
VLCLACFADDEQLVDAGTLAQAGLTRDRSPLLLHGSRDRLRWAGDGLVLGPWEFAWLTTGDR